MRRETGEEGRDGRQVIVFYFLYEVTSKSSVDVDSKVACALGTGKGLIVDVEWRVDSVFGRECIINGFSIIYFTSYSLHQAWRWYGDEKELVKDWVIYTFRKQFDFFKQWIPAKANKLKHSLSQNYLSTYFENVRYTESYRYNSLYQSLKKVQSLYTNFFHCPHLFVHDSMLVVE